MTETTALGAAIAAGAAVGLWDINERKESSEVTTFRPKLPENGIEPQHYLDYQKRLSIFKPNEYMTYWTYSSGVAAQLGARGKNLKGVPFNNRTKIQNILKIKIML